jgi:hypothetical protein
VREGFAGESVQRLHTVLVDALVDALAGIPDLDSPESRRMLIRTISKKSGGSFPDVPQHPTAREHLIEIVYACLQPPSGLRCLSWALRLMYPAHAGTWKVERIASSPAVLEVLSPEERRQVIELLGKLPKFDIKPIWYAATDDVGSLPATPPETPADAFDQLTGLNARTDGIPPSIAFVEMAACRATGDLATELRFWADGQAERIGLRAELASLRRSAIANPPPPVVPMPCLVVQFEEHPIKPGHYRLSHWIQQRPSAWNPECGDVQTVRWADAEQAVEGLIDQAEQKWGDRPGNVALEFVLPVSLLNEAVDWWRPGAPYSVPYCVRYPVVVRSLERMRDRGLHRVWLNRWAALLRAPSLNAKSALGFTGGLNTWNVQLHRDLDISAVVLSEPPQSSPAERGNHLWMALTAGVPVILWDRRSEPPNEFTDAANDLIGDLPMSLASRVQMLRQSAADNDDAAADEHPGKHIALLWDDPTRLVDQSPYTV